MSDFVRMGFEADVNHSETGPQKSGGQKQVPERPNLAGGGNPRTYGVG
jgi:hypothetical protein